MTEQSKVAPVEAQAVPDQPVARVLPKPGTEEVSKALDAMLAEYDFPCNSKNAARAGWEAANRWLASRPTPAAADLRSVVADHIADLRRCVVALLDYPELRRTAEEVTKAADELCAALVAASPAAAAGVPTREQINDMARQAGLPISWLDTGKASAWPELERFARLVLACPAAPAGAEEYRRANPLGGPAKQFDAIADAIRAGDSVDSAMRQFGVQWVAPAGAPTDEMHLQAEFQAQHEFLRWNRAQPEPLVRVAYEYGVFGEAVKLYRAALLSAGAPASPAQSDVHPAVNDAGQGSQIAGSALSTSAPLAEGSAEQAARFFDRIAQDKGASIAFLKCAGILDDSGELAEPYRGEPQ